MKGIALKIGKSSKLPIILLLIGIIIFFTVLSPAFLNSVYTSDMV